MTRPTGVPDHADHGSVERLSLYELSSYMVGPEKRPCTTVPTTHGRPWSGVVGKMTRPNKIIKYNILTLVPACGRCSRPCLPTPGPQSKPSPALAYPADTTCRGTRTRPRLNTLPAAPSQNHQRILTTTSNRLSSGPAPLA